MKFVDDSLVPYQPYPELRIVLETFLRELQDILAGNLVGVYLVGSLATGGFDLDSDIYFMTVIHNDLTNGDIHDLDAVMRRMHAMGCYPAEHLEGSFITTRDLVDWSTVGAKNLVYFDNGSTESELSTHDNKWHVRWILRECGVTLIGPKSETLLPPNKGVTRRADLPLTRRK